MNNLTPKRLNFALYLIAFSILFAAVQAFRHTALKRQTDNALRVVAGNWNRLFADASHCSLALSGQVLPTSTSSVRLDFRKIEGQSDAQILTAGAQLQNQNLFITQIEIVKKTQLGTSADGALQYTLAQLVVKAHDGTNTFETERAVTDFIVKTNSSDQIVGCADQTNDKHCTSLGKIYLPEQITPQNPGHGGIDAQGCVNYNSIVVLRK
jgi:hypothetical protein